jgi:hypothetical protein
LLFYDGAGCQLSCVEFRHDEAGHLIAEARTNGEETLPPLPPEMLASLNQAQLETVRALLGAGAERVRRTHRYDGQGRRAETRTRIGPLGRDIKTVTHDDHGDQIHEI